MLRRFASGSLVASVAVAVAASVLLVLPGPNFQRFYPVLAVWCFAPCAWGLWMMAAPSRWTPQRLPFWGAILGILAGSLAGFVLNLPSKVYGQTVSVTLRLVGVVAIVVFYYLMWHLVRMVYQRLTTPQPATSRTSAA